MSRKNLQQSKISFDRNKPKRMAYSMITFMLLLFITMIVLEIVKLKMQDKQAKPHIFTESAESSTSTNDNFSKMKFSLPLDSVTENASEETLEKFWNEVISPIIKQLREGGNLVPQTLTARFRNNLDGIRNNTRKAKKKPNYNEPLKINPSLRIHEISRHNRMTSVVENNIPKIGLYARELYSEYLVRVLGNKGAPDQDLAYAIDTAIGIIHESDHLALWHGRITSVEDFIGKEREAWNLTWQYTVGPMIEEYPQLVHPNYKSGYYKWKTAFEEGDIKALNQLIRERYPDSIKFFQGKYFASIKHAMTK